MRQRSTSSMSWASRAIEYWSSRTGGPSATTRPSARPATRVLTAFMAGPMSDGAAQPPSARAAAMLSLMPRLRTVTIMPGMDTRHVIARFESERQALALMDHPNITRVFDAGETASGRPYFVMELVRGLPITEYCDEHRLSIVERLELFVAVCRAVQHAGQGRKAAGE